VPGWIRLDGLWREVDVVAWFWLNGRWFASVRLTDATSGREPVNVWYHPEAVIERRPGERPLE
jgi:hypothetical protein